MSLLKTLKSAIANALGKQIAQESLFIKSIDVVEGTAFKRFHASTRGRAHPYKKKSSHIKVILGVKPINQVQKTENVTKDLEPKIKDQKSKIKNEQIEKGDK